MLLDVRFIPRRASAPYTRADDMIIRVDDTEEYVQDDPDPRVIATCAVDLSVIGHRVNDLIFPIADIRFPGDVHAVIKVIELIDSVSNPFVSERIYLPNTATGTAELIRVTHRYPDKPSKRYICPQPVPGRRMLAEPITELVLRTMDAVKDPNNRTMLDIIAGTHEDILDRIRLVEFTYDVGPMLYDIQSVCSAINGALAQADFYERDAERREQSVITLLHELSRIVRLSPNYTSFCGSDTYGVLHSGATVTIDELGISYVRRRIDASPASEVPTTDTPIVETLYAFSIFLDLITMLTITDLKFILDDGVLTIAHSVNRYAYLYCPGTSFDVSVVSDALITSVYEGVSKALGCEINRYRSRITVEITHDDEVSILYHGEHGHRTFYFDLNRCATLTPTVVERGDCWRINGAGGFNPMIPEGPSAIDYYMRGMI